MSLNKVTLSGYLGADAELRYTKGGSAVLTFSLAVNERVPKGDGEWGEHTNWIDCAVFGKRAEGLEPYLRRGSKVALVGCVHASSYEKDGRSVKKVQVRVHDVELMNRRRDGAADAACECFEEA